MRAHYFPSAKCERSAEALHAPSVRRVSSTDCDDDADYGRTTRCDMPVRNGQAAVQTCTPAVCRRSVVGGPPATCQLIPSTSRSGVETIASALGNVRRRFDTAITVAGCSRRCRSSRSGTSLRPQFRLRTSLPLFYVSARMYGSSKSCHFRRYNRNQSLQAVRQHNP